MGDFARNKTELRLLFYAILYLINLIQSLVTFVLDKFIFGCSSSCSCKLLGGRCMSIFVCVGVLFVAKRRLQSFFRNNNNLISSYSIEFFRAYL